MATKLAETMNKTVIIIHKPFIFFFKNCVSSLSVTSANMEGISAFFVLFYNVNYRFEQLFKIFRSGQKQQTTQSIALADH